MDYPDPLRAKIYNNMQLKTTHELHLILEQDDHEEWSDTAFEVVRQILLERTGEWYPLDFAIRSAFILSQDGELRFDSHFKTT